MKPLSRLLVVANTDGYVAVHMRDFLRCLQEAQVQVHVLSPGGAFVHDLRTHGMEWTELPLARGRRGILWAPRAFAALRRTQRRIHPDVTLAVTAAPVLLAAMSTVRSAESLAVGVIPGLGHYFGIGRRGGNFERAILRGSFRWAAGRARSRMVFQLVADRDRILGDRRDLLSQAEVIPGWGVDLDRFRRTKGSTPSPMVAMISRLLWEKGVGEFVEAARALRASGSAARFVMVGEPDVGNPGSISVEQLKTWNAEGIVEWWGRREDIPAILSQTALLALPTKYGEGVPRVLVEAGAAAVPVVAGDVPGCRVIIQNGVNGFIVPPGDAVHLASAIRRLLDRPDLRQEMGTANLAVVTEDFDVRRVVAGYAEVFSRLGLRLGS